MTLHLEPTPEPCAAPGPGHCHRRPATPGRLRRCSPRLLDTESHAPTNATESERVREGHNAGVPSTGVGVWIDFRLASCQCGSTERLRTPASHPLTSSARACARGMRCFLRLLPCPPIGDVPQRTPKHRLLRGTRNVYRLSVSVLLGGVARDSSQLTDEVVINPYQYVPTAFVPHRPLAFYCLNRNIPSVYRTIG